MSEPKKEAEPKFREARVENLCARIYANGEVRIGMKIMKGKSEIEDSIEIELTTNPKKARDFCEKFLGIINNHEKRY